MENRDLFYNQIKDKYGKIFHQFMTFKKKSTPAKAVSRNDYKNMMEILNKKFCEFEEQFQKLENSTGESWESLREPVERSLEKLDQFLGIVLKRFGK